MPASRREPCISVTTAVADSSSRTSSGQPARCGITNSCSNEVIQEHRPDRHEREPPAGSRLLRPLVKKLSSPETRA